VTLKFGVTQGVGWPPIPLAVTEKSTPAYAELVPTSIVLFFCRLTSVRRPTTAEGLTTNTLPKPLLVFMAAPRVPEQPPVHTPVVQLWPVEQSASLEHDVAHMPKCVVASIFTQVPPIAEQSASAAQVPALQVVPPVIWPLFLFSWQ